MNNRNWAYDIEIFKNFFCCTFMNIQDSAEYYAYTIAWDLGIDESKEMEDFLANKVDCLIGYNNLFFDYPVLEFVYNYNGDSINKDIYKLSQKMINSERGESFGGYRKNYLWKQMDLMKIMAFDKLGVSLKQCAINLKWKKIQDLPLPYDHTVSKDEVELVLKYNLNDVLITKELYDAMIEEINLRKELSEIYDADLSNASDSKIANILLEKIYAEETGIDISQIKNLRTKRDFLWLRDCLCPGIKFKTKKLRDLKLEIANTLVVAENNFAYKKKIHFGSCDYELGIGGLHSKDFPAVFKSDKNYLITDNDVSSYYPSIMIKNKIKPEHLSENFIDILEKITKDRLEAKKSKNKKATLLKHEFRHRIPSQNPQG